MEQYLSENQILRIVSDVINEQVYTNVDSGYNYKVQNGEWVASKKSAPNNWFSIAKYPASIAKLDKLYPNERKKGFETSLVKSKNNVGTQELRFGSRGTDVSELQGKLLSLNYNIGAKSPTGYFGNGTKLALIKFQTDNNLEPTGIFDKETSNKLRSSKSQKVKEIGNYIIEFAFPDYEPRADGGEKVSFFGRVFTGNFSGDSSKYGKVGHGGCAIVLKNGIVKLFEYGRYKTPKGFGRVVSKDLGRIAKISPEGKLLNSKVVSETIRKRSEGKGPSMKMKVAVVPLPNPNGALAYATGSGLRKYNNIDMKAGGVEGDNCGTYSLETAIQGGVNVPQFCSPFPNHIVNSFRRVSVEFFEI